MSVEHGSHGEETSVTGIISAIFLAVLGIGQVLEKVEETVQAVMAPEAHGFGGHH